MIDGIQEIFLISLLAVRHFGFYGSETILMTIIRPAIRQVNGLLGLVGLGYPGNRE
jgi:hypothetical protein